MLTIVTSDSRVVYAGDDRVHGDLLPEGTRVERWAIKSMAEAEALAVRATRDLAPRKFLAADAGENVSPRYDVIEAYKVGDKVGYEFNGDRYADGEIIRISESGRVITTSTGKRYYRHKQSSSWLQTGGTWVLSRGHHTTTNWDL